MLETYDDLLTVDEACEALKVGKNALYALLAEKKLKAYKNACKQKVKQKLSEICRCREGEKQQHKKAAASASA